MGFSLEIERLVLIDSVLEHMMRNHLSMRSILFLVLLFVEVGCGVADAAHWDGSIPDATSPVMSATVSPGQERRLVAWGSWDGNGYGPCQNPDGGSWTVTTTPTKGVVSYHYMYQSAWNCSTSLGPYPYLGIFYTANPTTSQTTDTLSATWADATGLTHSHTFNITIVPDKDVAKNNGESDDGCPTACDGNPINGGTGNKYQKEVDFIGGPSTGLTIRRVYNSQDQNTSVFGAKWRSNWQGTLTILNGGAQIAVLRPSGRQETFAKNASNVYVSDADVRTRLSAIPGGWRVVASNDDTEDYTSDGRLSKITARSGLVTALTYDASNRLTQVAGPFGHKLLFTYDASNRVSQVTTPDGQAYKYGYDVSGNLVSVTYPDAKVRRYVYENASLPNALTGIIDENGARFATFAYQANGYAISSEHAGSVEKTTFAYNADNTTTITTPLGAARTYAFNTQFGMAKPSTVTGAAVTSSGGKAFAYDANGFLSSRTDWNNYVTTYTHDSRGSETSHTEASGTAVARTVTTTWHASYHLPLTRAEPGRTFAYTYDANGNLLSKAITAGTLVRTYSYTYSAVGQVLTATDPAGNVTTYGYDVSGNLASVKNALGQVTSYTNYDGAGRLTRIVDPNAVVTLLTYDARGRLIQVATDATGTSPATTTIQYDGVSQITKITQPDGAFETFAYDSAHRLMTVTNAVGETINYARDANSDVTSVSIKRADGTVAYSHSQTFDQLGRVVSAIGAGSQSYQFAYDNNDNLIKVTDPRANIHQYGYDALNRLSVDTDEEGKAVTLTRNGINTITSYTDARGLATAYNRNGYGETTSVVSPDKGTTTYSRDARGLVATRTDARGMATSYVYDKLGRATNKDYTDGTYWQSFAWDAAQPNAVGRLSGVYSEAGTSWRVFDAKGRITVDYRTNNPAPALATQYAYDASGNVLHIAYPSGRIINYTRDAAGRISGVTTQNSLGAADQTIVYNVTWNPFGPLAQMTFGYGAIAKFSTDSDYRIIRYQLGSTTDSSAIIDRSLAWTGDTVTSIVDNKNPSTTPGQYGSQSQSFTYTPTRRLASATGYYGALGWTYDTNGNRLTETANGVVSTYAYPTTSNRLTSVTPSGQTARTFTYDAAGDILTDTRTGALGMTFQYDVEGRLSKAYQTNASAQGGTYAYDAFNRLASRTANGTTTLYVHDINNHIIAETNTAGVTLREYIWLNDLPVAVVDGVNTPAPIIYYVHTDHLGRPARMMAQSWAWVWDVIYSPFGGMSYLWDSTAKLDARFPGQWFQLESGLAYNWHRHYDATLGRYLQPDPIGYAGGRNLYGYVGGNPLVYIDPRGLDWSSDFQNYISESYQRLADAPRQFMNDPSGSIQSGLESTPAVAPELAALRGANRLANAVQAANEANGNGQGYCSPLNIDPSQFGKKAAKHMPDFNLNPSNAADRKAFEDIVKDIANAPDFVRDGTWSGANPNGIPAQFRIKGQDVVITSPDGNFITVLRNGADQASVINSIK